MKPQEWNVALAPDVPTLDAYRIVGVEARKVLEHTQGMISTTTLGNLLYPPEFVTTDEHQAARKRLFQALTARALGAHSLADCMTLGLPKKNKFGRTQRPALWHSPQAKPKCPQCGRPL